MTELENLRYPIGRFTPPASSGAATRAEHITALRYLPGNLQAAVSGLTNPQLNTPYREGGWTVRQLVHHIADSHANAYVRFKLALTEDRPTIKPYDEGRWAALADSLSGDIRTPLALLDGLHARWVHLLRSMKPEQFARTFFHPESNEIVSLSAALCSYAWHCRHHTAQITWLRKQHGW